MAVTSLKHRIWSHSLALLISLALLFVVTAHAQHRKTRQTKPPNELAQLQEEFIKATKEYKANLGRLLAIYERNVTKAEEKLVQTQKLFADGLIARNQLTETEAAVAAAKDKVNEAKRQMANADTQIADTLIEARAEAQMSKKPLRRGSLVNTASYIRYSGAGNWALSEAWKAQRFFLDSFKKQLPVGVFGQGAIHDRWRLDHRNAMDVSLHPDGPEGQALLHFLRASGIPFLAFRAAIPGTATGPHIHIGRPSHRY
ncbi:MAG: TolC family protein [Acidobacteriota bacterium]|nr:TolC family protein [Acidobacteriota bacterium]